MPEKKEDGNPWFEILLVVGLMVLLIVGWYAQGGPKKFKVGGLFLPAPDTTSPSGGIPSIEAPGLTTAKPLYYATSQGNSPQTGPQLGGTSRSPQNGSVTLQQYGGTRSNDPELEYIELYANPGNSAPVAISGWHLKSTITGKEATIGGGVHTPRLSSTMTTGIIELLPGQTAIVTTGRSPIGVSFLENECMGYLSEFQKFSPALSLSCPFPGQELSIYTNPALAQDSSCVSAVSHLAPCQTVLTAPYGVTSACSDFITQRFTYNGCVATHSADQNFEGRQWRLYLNQSQELWNNQSDIIELLDQNGRLVSSITY